MSESAPRRAKVGPNLLRAESRGAELSVYHFEVTASIAHCFVYYRERFLFCIAAFKNNAKVIGVSFKIKELKLKLLNQGHLYR